MTSKYERKTDSGIYVESDPNRELVWWDPYRWQSDPQYLNFIRQDRTIFKRNPKLDKKPPKQLNYEYSDRLVQVDEEKSESAWTVALESGTQPKSAAFIEQYLTNYYGKAVEVWQIGVAVVDGWPVRSYGFIYKK